ncbi:MAG: 2-oxoacid:acceptor oxidoreductase subunit alpha [Rubritepida sp.]|nr:2-oxoacid:acceptor oxidoreductase subunit alpha [Rubritepida sp.]
MTAGNLVLEAAAKAGWYGLMVRSSGPQIRGGEAAALLRVADHPVDGLDDAFDVLLAIDWENVHRFADEIPLTAASLIVGDPGQGEPPEAYRGSGAAVGTVPFKQIAKAIAGAWPNMVALGVIAGLLGLPPDIVREVARGSLKKPEAREASAAAIDAGLAAAAGLGSEFPLATATRGVAPRWLFSGNEAAGYGALRGGVRFVAAYPITPATEILEWMAPALSRVGGTLVQAEDELASINMILGASYGGVPSLTATAGPGLSLMTEALGLGVAAEIPIVVVDVMRGGPSTGIPAKSEQGDLGMALYGLHGDAPRLVMAPNSVSDCLHTAQWAVELAESLQSVAIVLSDQFLGQTRAVVDRPPDREVRGTRLLAEAGAEGYRRYALTESGVSPMALPGMPGLAYTADGLEHTERGIPTSQAREHGAQLDKRHRKLAGHDYGAQWADVEGEGDVAVLTFGSCTGPAREAAARARADGLAVRLVSMRLLAPARPALLAAALEGVSRVLVVEQNHSGQFHRYLRAEYDLAAELVSFRRPGPLPLRPDEIHRQLLKWRQA